MSKPRYRLAGRMERGAEHEPLVELLIAVVMRARRDIEEAQKRGDRATETQLAHKRSAERFLAECRKNFA